MARTIDVFKAGSFIAYRDDNGLIQTDIVDRIINMGRITAVSLGTEVVIEFKNGDIVFFNSSGNTTEDRINGTNRIYSMFLVELQTKYPEYYQKFDDQLKEIEKNFKKEIKNTPTVKKLNKASRKRLATLGSVILLTTSIGGAYKITHPKVDTDVNKPNTSSDHSYSSETTEASSTAPTTKDIPGITYNNTQPTTQYSADTFTSYDDNVFDIQIDYHSQPLDYRELTLHPEYEEYLKKYSEEFHVDYNLMRGIALQENGDGYNGFAYGLMQVENIWVGNVIEAYNFKKNEKVKYYVYDSNENVPEQLYYKDSIGNVVEYKDINVPENNIMFGCMVFQQCLTYTNDNLLAALQCYNFGPGNFDYVLSCYGWASGLSRDEILADKKNISWTDYLTNVSAGDPSYIKHIMQWLDEDNTFVTYNNDGSICDTYNVSSRQRIK